MQIQPHEDKNFRGREVFQSLCMTKQNAQLVEDKAASARDLKVQSGSLVETVAVFKLP